MTLGQNIKKYRNSLKMTQQVLAKKVDVTQPNVYRWEKDLVSPSIDTIKKIATALRVSVDGLLFSEEERKNLQITDKELLERIKDLDKLAPEDRTAIAQLIDSLKLKSKG